ncbi:hypothetical protein JXJ21_18330 [candidate division KSB1 bacterium]|nr:hypothetical protein [candidate division KSB1 bacterium]
MNSLLKKLAHFDKLNHQKKSLHRLICKKIPPGTACQDFILPPLKRLNAINQSILEIRFVGLTNMLDEWQKELVERIVSENQIISEAEAQLDSSGEFAATPQNLHDSEEERRRDPCRQILDKLAERLNANVLFAKKFSKEVKARYQQQLSVKVIGFGEISTVLELTGGGTYAQPLPDRYRWVYKKMPVFPHLEGAEMYAALYREYFSIITVDIGIRIPQQKIHIHPVSDGKVRIYALQEKVPVESVGHRLIHRLEEDECALLMRMILGEIKKVAVFNQRQSRIKLAIDAQISNWAFPEVDLREARLSGNESVVFIDTSSPLYRVDGIEQLDAEIFLKSTPFFLRPVIRALFLQDVLDRYYDIHLDTVDLIANLYKEGRPEIIPLLISVANAFFANEMVDFGIQPITLEEVTKYYKEDAFIWKFYLAARKIDRFITEKVLRRTYEFRLPDHVQR